jgi:hypothetical protein
MSYILFIVWFFVVFVACKPKKHRFMWFAFVSVMSSSLALGSLKDWALWMLGCFAAAQVFAIIERSYTVAILGGRQFMATYTRLDQLEKMGLGSTRNTYFELNKKGQKLNNLINRIRRFIGSPDNL